MTDKTTVAIGCDEAGFALKQIIIEHLKAQGVEISDYGCHSNDPVDYPDVAKQLALDIAAKKTDRGILICGTGIGMAIAANKVPGVYAAQAHDTFSAERARKSNNAQMITMGARVIGPNWPSRSSPTGWPANSPAATAPEKSKKLRPLKRPNKPAFDNKHQPHSFILLRPPAEEPGRFSIDRHPYTDCSYTSVLDAKPRR